MALGEGYIILGEGGCSCWLSIPKLLDNKLRGRQASLPPPTYVAIGSCDRYYVQFADGQSQWVASDWFGDNIKSTDCSVKTVAFGESYESYFIVYSGGSFSYNDVPEGLVERMESRGNLCDLEFVSLGPDGEWFVSAQNGRAWWGGLTEDGYELIATVRDRITSMVFGEDGNMHVRYE